jgi:hypothetical protein
LGDVPNLPGSISLAALGAASLGVDYIKVGLYGLKTPKEAVFLLQNVNNAAKACNSKAQVDRAMVDTAVKDGKNLFSFLSAKQLEKFISSAHKLGLEVALAGSLRKQDLHVVYGLGADVAGLRGAACTNSDRVKGQITRKLVLELVETVKQAESQAKKRA